MIYEELLAKIDHMWDDDFDHVIKQNRKALRAVVELHKPVVDSFICRACYHKTDEITFVETYPCPTIQAIEKELN